MDEFDLFEQDCNREVASLSADKQLHELTRAWFDAAAVHKYSYHFKALGRPVIQYPQDVIAIQEIIWATRPSLIIETGIAHGGSLIWSAAMLALLDYCDAANETGHLDIQESSRRVIGIDIDIRAHNRAAIDAHPMRHKIEMVQGSSIDPAVVTKVHSRVKQDDRVLVLLDSNHTHDHVMSELEAYAPLVTPGSYCVAFDTVIEDLPRDSFGERPWNVGDNPKTAVRDFLRSLETTPRQGRDGTRLRLEIDRAFDNKLLITVAPEGYLKRPLA